jgi:leader peptidase (prepilin peptidase)/N-methyltransferase
VNDLAAGLAAAGLAMLAGAAGPAVIGRLPEPELPPRPAEGEETRTGRLSIDEVHEKTSYAELAARPRLGWWLALGSAVAGAVLGYRLGWGGDLLVLLPLVPVGVWLGYVDWRTTFLPTRLVAPAYALTAVLVVSVCAVDGSWTDARRAAVGWAVYGGLFLLMWAITGGFGYGDVRLAGVLGIALGFLGWSPLLLGLVGALFLGGIGGLVLVLLRLVDAKRNPFGPYMLVAAGIAATYGPTIADRLGY